MALVPGLARAEIEAGALVGVHVFSGENALGRFQLDGSNTALKTAPALGIRVAWLPHERFGVEGELAALPTSTNDDRSVVTIVSYRAHVLGNLLTGRFRPFLLVGAGGITAMPADPFYFRRDTDANFHGGGGVRFDFASTWGLRADGRAIMVPSSASDGFTWDQEYTLGIYGRFPWEPPPARSFDQDGDDIADDVDECPEQAGDIRSGGCPEEAGAEEEEEEGTEEKAPTDGSGSGPAVDGSPPAGANPSGGKP